MLRKSLQNYARVKSASSHSKGSSDYASCKENIPAHGGQANSCTACIDFESSSHNTPISRSDHVKANSQSAQAAGHESLQLTVRQYSVRTADLACPASEYSLPLSLQPVPSHISHESGRGKSFTH